MTEKADAVRAVSQQFKDRTHSVIDGVMAHLRDDNAKELLGPGLSPLIGRGSLKSIVTFALYADVLRMVRDIVMADGGISDEEVRESLGLLSVLAAGFANVRKEYAPYNALSADNVRNFLAHYNTDKGLFGHGNEATRWSGVRICQAVHAYCGDFRPLAKFNGALLEWATAIANSDTATEAEQVVLHSLTAFLSKTSQTTAAAAGAISSTQSVQCVSAAPDGCDSAGQEKAIEKACPYCGEKILAVAIKCKHCGEMLAPKPSTYALDANSAAPDNLAEAKYDAATDTFSGSTQLLCKLAIQAVQDLGWTLGNVNESVGIVSFETGISWGSFSGVSCTLTIQEVSRGRYRVTGTGKQNVRGGQLWAPDIGGEAKSKATRAITMMKKLVGHQGSDPDPNYGPAVFLGLNKKGVTLFVVLLLLSFPFAWLPWVMKSCKGA